MEKITLNKKIFEILKSLAILEIGLGFVGSAAFGIEAESFITFLVSWYYCWLIGGVIIVINEILKGLYLINEKLDNILYNTTNKVSEIKTPEATVSKTEPKAESNTKITDIKIPNNVVGEHISAGEIGNKLNKLESNILKGDAITEDDVKAYIELTSKFTNASIVMIEDIKGSLVLSAGSENKALTDYYENIYQDKESEIKELGLSLSQIANSLLTAKSVQQAKDIRKKITTIANSMD